MQVESGSPVISVDPLLPAEARAPRSPEDTGLPLLFLVELVAKVLFQRGQVRLPELAAHLKLSISVITPLVTHLRTEKLCEVTRSGHSGTDADLTYHLTEAGVQRAMACLNRNSYAGPAPVTLAAYVAQVEAQSVRNLHVTRPHVQAAYHDVVASPAVLDQLGAAMNSGRAIFIYGQAGSGKTFLAERLSGLLHGAIAVPYAIMIDGEVVPFYDPVQHRPATDADADAARAASAADFGDRNRTLDARWVRGIQRPAALTGGELTLEMLDLRFDANTRLYQAPPHLKANNGIFIIDDLGRQRCSPLELMNRWIVPMDRGVDYLSLHTGLVFQVPFDVVVVFSSNFLPERLSDGAFLRRLGYKIEVPPQTQAEYKQLFRQACAQYGIAFDDAAFDYLLTQRHARDDTPLLACYPRDLVRQVRDLARYEGSPPQLNPRAIDWAWNTYFAGAGARRVAAEQQKQARERRDHTIPG
ncbi:ATP-binding protein [Duganella sp. FT134W]|uniref:ATP-binding protein n=1 Tax=Duganella margarita TaxID=2692170 RepID=A0A7X4H5D9_9BURK|nr:ATP-binding protein [Duganella margarita]MYM75076.1 ATP-binding protein [Duganella margarita]